MKKVFAITINSTLERGVLTDASSGSFLSLLQKEGYTEPEAPCGGCGKCRKCLIRVSGPVFSAESGKVREAREETIPACCYAPAGDCRITLLPRTAMRVSTEGSTDLPPGGEGLGFAADIGTTTVAAFLYELRSGKLLGKLGERNVQRSFGADVISRITACSEGKLPELKSGIRRQLADMLNTLLAQAGKTLPEIKKISVAGNTVMEHIFAGLSPESIGTAPFTPLSLFGDCRPGAEYLPGTDAELFLCPCTAAYVGGDITAGLYASGGDTAEGPVLYIDIGTNGEMALGSKDGFLSCATAAGPAFEGAEISCGMSGEAGAIDRVRVLPDGTLSVHVIGETAAKGICGSGLIDAVACLLRLGILTESGRFAEPEEISPGLRSRLTRAADGQKAFLLADGVFLSAQDVREVQLAKAALRAGAETLLAAQQKKASDVTALILAGGFGSYMNKESALAISLLPEVPPERITHAGNAAGAGAALALTETGKNDLLAFAEKCSYLELSSSPEFMDNYVEYMAF